MRILFALAVVLPAAAWADGGSDEPPANPTVFCTAGEVYDPKLRKCVKANSGALDRDTLYEAVRQLAYAGRYVEAQTVLDAMPEDDPGRLTYMGFTHRKMGNADLAASYYQAAIDRDPANFLARSYMGQGFVDQGEIAKAMVQLHQIRAHGGSGTWSERALAKSIETGTTYGY